jgi:hypothetical protein
VYDCELSFRQSLFKLLVPLLSLLSLLEAPAPAFSCSVLAFKAAAAFSNCNIASSAVPFSGFSTTGFPIDAIFLNASLKLDVGPCFSRQSFVDLRQGLTPLMFGRCSTFLT